MIANLTGRSQYVLLDPRKEQATLRIPASTSIPITLTLDNYPSVFSMSTALSRPGKLMNCLLIWLQIDGIWDSAGPVKWLRTNNKH